MASYGIYDNINESKITSGTASIRSKINQVKTGVQETKTSLTEEVWKATAKKTLFTAFDTITDEVCKELLGYLDDLDTIAGLIQKHKVAENKAKQYTSEMNAATKENKNYYRQLKNQSEQSMSEYERQINALKNG